MICRNICLMEKYRSGRNGAHSKCVWGQPHAGSNPAFSVQTKPANKAGFFVAEISLEARIKRDLNTYNFVAVFCERSDPCVS